MFAVAARCGQFGELLLQGPVPGECALDFTDRTLHLLDSTVMLLDPPHLPFARFADIMGDDPLFSGRGFTR